MSPSWDIQLVLCVVPSGTCGLVVLGDPAFNCPSAKICESVAFAVTPVHCSHDMVSWS